jgi:hypothetical protein
MKTELNIVKHQKCSEIYKSQHKILNSQLCALRPGHDSW